MKSASVFSCLFVSLCLLHSAESNFGDFLSNLPREIGDAFTSAWASVVDAIRKPVRIKRLGPGGKRKTTTIATPPTITTTESPEIVKSFNIYPSIKGLKIPIFPSPRWQTIDEWKYLQIPRFVKVRRNEKGPSTVYENEMMDDVDIAPAATGSTNFDDGDNFGVLFFI